MTSRSRQIGTTFLGLALLLPVAAPGSEGEGHHDTRRTTPLRVDEHRIVVRLTADAAGAEALSHLLSTARDIRHLGGRILEATVEGGTLHDRARALRGYRGVAFAEPMLHAGESARYPMPRVLVGLHDGADRTALRQLERSLGATMRPLAWAAPGTYLVELPRRRDYDVLDATRRFAEHPAVRYAEPDLYHPDALLGAPPSDPFFGLQWALENTLGPPYDAEADIEALVAWDVTLGEDDIVVAVIDTGIDYSHPDLQGRLLPGADFTGEPPPGGIPGNAPCDFPDDAAHGTSVAGVIAALHNTIGVAGVAPGVKLLPIRVEFTSSSLTSAVGYAWQHGADVINGSWVFSPTSSLVAALDDARTLGRDGLGTLLVFGSGNSNQAQVSSPASLPTTIAVGGTSPCDERKSPTSCDEFDSVPDNAKYIGSNYGTALDLVAPSTQSPTLDIAGPTCGWAASRFVHDASGDYITNWAGTSAATPHVAGTVALMLSVRDDLPVDAVTGLLLLAADDQTGPVGQQDPAGWDAEKGWGRVDAGAAVAAIQALDTSTVYVDRDHSGLETGAASHPFDTVAEAAVAVDPAGTIVFEAGTYTAGDLDVLTGPVVLDARNGPAVFH